MRTRDSKPKFVELDENLDKKDRNDIYYDETYNKNFDITCEIQVSPDPFFCGKLPWNLRLLTVTFREKGEIWTSHVIKHQKNVQKFYNDLKLNFIADHSKKMKKNPPFNVCLQ